MVPELAAGIRSGAPSPARPRITSVMRCEVSTLPAAMAAGSPAFTTLPLRRDHAIGRSSPRCRDVLGIDQAAEAVHRRRNGDRIIGVHRPRRPAARSGEIDRRGSRMNARRATAIAPARRVTPSLSRKSSKRYSPSGIAAQPRASRARVIQQSAALRWTRAARSGPRFRADGLAAPDWPSPAPADRPRALRACARWRGSDLHHVALDRPPRISRTGGMRRPS
jgi:hypothetical protein